ncbi:MAG: pyruvate formate-lyase [Firmicutes bacterium HGW-Firmicutes-5]|nr:MAG: pyruvate formate-lyase [Firmicutes bacterium HGW-Firmicutes-5]
MAKFDINGAQNVEVSKKLPCEKSIESQLNIMEHYTRVHKENATSTKEKREVECLKVLYPRLFRSIVSTDKIVGRLDILPIGFGSVTSLGGVGHYCVFQKLLEFKDMLDKEEDKSRVDAIYDYWVDHDIKTIYCNEVLTDATIGRFISTEFPLIATARLSGMMLDYPKLLDKGINGLKNDIMEHQGKDPTNAFYEGALEGLNLFTECALFLEQQVLEEIEDASEERKSELNKMANALKKISTDKPESFHEALQLIWLYALMSGVINYGRLDDYLGPYMSRDIDSGKITEDDAYDYLLSLWTMIENRRTTVNGRIIVGGKGRKNPKEADRFLRIAMKVAKNTKFVEPQFTLRFDRETPDDIWEMSMDALGAGATYPTLYNDDVNVPAVSYGMRINEEDAKQYVPFGCTEFVIQGKSTGTPNVCINLLKLLNVFMNEGIDPMDGVDKSSGYIIRKLDSYTTFEDFYSSFKEFLNVYLDLSAEAQFHSYKVMDRYVSFLYQSILTDDCISSGKSILGGGVRYLGGTNETYGNINTSDSLWAIKHLVFDTHKYSFNELNRAVLANFEGYEHIRKDCWKCDKYGNDLDTADNMANDLYEFVAKGVRDRGIKLGMQYFLIVISNNQLNTEWGLNTDASPDGRYRGMYMNPANNPQGGANISGPTALLNSLAKFDAKYHAGSVQNIKFSKYMFNENKEIITDLFKTYFAKGGSHLMVTVIDKGVLEDAVKNPEKYPDLIVRVSGFSAVFVNLSSDVQKELLSRVMYG